MKLCKVMDVYGNVQEGQPLVDTKWSVRKSYYKQNVENGKTFFICTNTDTKTKKAQLAKLSATK